MSTIIIIPARYASSRYPGKPLAHLTGADGTKKSLIQRSWEAGISVNNVDKVVIATDDQRIKDAATDFGAEAVMTSENCQNGTERCAEAVKNLGQSYDIVVNLQGDAPLTPAWFIEDLVTGLHNNPKAQVATPVLQTSGAMLRDLLNDRKEGRVGGTTAVFGAQKNGLYFSKEVIPFTGKTYSDNEATPVYHHVGVYAYRPSALEKYASWNIGPLETLEGLEQLRFLENASELLCVEVAAKGRQFWELNNPEDVPKIEAMLREMELS